MQLNELYDYKNQLMGEILTNREIIRLLNADLAGLDPDDEEDMRKIVDTLAYKQVFPYEFIPDTVEHGTSFICFDVDIQRASDKLYYYPTLYIWVFSHSSLLRNEEGTIIPDAICSELANMLNGSRYYGLGELDLYSAKRFSPMTDYQGKVLTFNAVDFNRFNPTGKPIPSNRKKAENVR